MGIITKMLGKILTLIAILSLAKAQIISGGPCANVSNVPDFQLNDYMGIWYEYAKSRFIFEAFGTCVFANYTANDDNTVTVVNTMKLLGRNISVNAVAVDDEDDPNVGRLKVSFNNPLSISSPYWVIGTDYHSYAVVYSCSAVFGLVKSEVMWILTRDRQPSEEAITEATNVVTNNGLDLSYLYLTDQDNCGDDGGADGGPEIEPSVEDAEEFDWPDDHV